MSAHLPNDPLCQALAEVIQRLDAEPVMCVSRSADYVGGFNIATINSLAESKGLVTPPARVFQLVEDKAEKRHTLRLYQPDNWPCIDLLMADPVLGKDNAWQTKIVTMKQALEKWLAARQAQIDRLAAENEAASAPRPVGRPMASDPEADARIAAGWDPKLYRTFADYARTLKHFTEAGEPDAARVKSAVDRHRKRRTRQKPTE
jgi:hypothetical protein